MGIKKNMDAPVTKRDLLNTEKRIVDKIVKKLNILINNFGLK